MTYNAPSVGRGHNKLLLADIGVYTGPCFALCCANYAAAEGRQFYGPPNWGRGSNFFSINYRKVNVWWNFEIKYIYWI